MIRVKLSRIELQNVEEFKYLGCMHSSSIKNDEEMLIRMRGIYAGGYVLISRFKSVLTHENELVQAYCTNIHGCSLWNNSNAGTVASSSSVTPRVLAEISNESHIKISTHKGFNSG